jgi:hypothetical protein
MLRGQVVDAALAVFEATACPLAAQLFLALEAGGARRRPALLASRRRVAVLAVAGAPRARPAGTGGVGAGEGGRTPWRCCAPSSRPRGPLPPGASAAAP